MGSHLTISYRHNRVTGEPLFAGNEIAACVARDVRQQLTRGDDGVLAIDLERLTRVGAMRVNDITYELEWSTDAPVTDDRGKPVLGVCEVDPVGLPDTALICVNPDPVEGRTELLLSTGAHEMGHGIFEAPAWIYAHQRSSMPTLFDVVDPAAPRRVWRTTTPNESHFSATYPPGSTEFFQETRANEFMGSLLTPRRLLSRQFSMHCEALELWPADIVGNARRSLFPVSRRSQAADQGEGNLGFLRLHVRLGLEQVITLLAMDFGVTRRFIEVRLKKYGLLPQELAVL
ncbi:MAG: hypothetical protein ACREJ0_27745 [Geminicoccaceae bacterium]